MYKKHGTPYGEETDLCLPQGDELQTVANVCESASLLSSPSSIQVGVNLLDENITHENQRRTKLLASRMVGKYMDTRATLP